MDDDRDVTVPFGSEDEMVEPLSIDVAVPDVADHPQVRVCEAHPGGRRYRAAVDAVETVDVYVVDQFSMATDPAEEDEVLKGYALLLREFGDGRLDHVLDREVAAPGAPGVLCRGDEPAGRLSGKLFRAHAIT